MIVMRKLNNDGLRQIPIWNNQEGFSRCSQDGFKFIVAPSIPASQGWPHHFDYHHHHHHHHYHHQRPILRHIEEGLQDPKLTSLTRHSLQWATVGHDVQHTEDCASTDVTYHTVCMNCDGQRQDKRFNTQHISLCRTCCVVLCSSWIQIVQDSILHLIMC